MQDDPATTTWSRRQGLPRALACSPSGGPREAVCLDPGIGFGRRSSTFGSGGGCRAGRAGRPDGRPFARARSTHPRQPGSDVGFDQRPVGRRGVQRGARPRVHDVRAHVERSGRGGGAWGVKVVAARPRVVRLSRRPRGGARPGQRFLYVGEVGDRGADDRLDGAVDYRMRRLPCVRSQAASSGCSRRSTAIADMLVERFGRRQGGSASRTCARAGSTSSSRP